MVCMSPSCAPRPYQKFSKFKLATKCKVYKGSVMYGRAKLRKLCFGFRDAYKDVSQLWRWRIVVPKDVGNGAI